MTRRRPARPPQQRRSSPSRSRLPTLAAFLVVAALVALGLADRGQLPGGLDDFLPRPSPAAADLEGPVTQVRDGDTIEVAGVPVRIANLDCAEMDTAEGQSAGLFMRDLVRGQAVMCELEGRMSYDRNKGKGSDNKD